MMSWTRGIVAVMAIGATGIGCELVLTADRSRLGETSGTGGNASAGSTTATATAASAGGAGGGASSSTGIDGGTTSSASGTGGSGGMPVIPPAPILGAQIDRMGRPAINTALNHVFDSNLATQGAAKDAYNQNADSTTWPASSGAEFAANLAILDCLDTKCGNQLLAGPMPVAGRYNTLAGALSDDRLYVNTAGATCTTYLAVEANATGILTNMDCGGRKLDYDVIDVTYSALAVGALSGVGDGVLADADTKGTIFPYVALPH
jgi:hypothetical protein